MRTMTAASIFVRQPKEVCTVTLDPRGFWQKGRQRLGDQCSIISKHSPNTDVSNICHKTPTPPSCHPARTPPR
jgi:hypothetical protein